MRVLRWAHHQLADALGDFVLPLLAAMLPRALANRMLWRAAGLRWLFPGIAPTIEASETVCFEAPSGLYRRWAWTTLMEAAQAWRLLLGLRPRLRVDGRWPQAPGFLAAGMHYGSGITALWHLREAGLAPRFVFRPVGRDDLPGRPVKFVWYRLRTRLIERLCPDGPITTGGAGEVIVDSLRRGRATPVLLFDTPSTQPSDWRLRVGHGEIALRAGGARLFSRIRPDVAFFTVTLDRDSGTETLTITRLDPESPLRDQIMARMQARMRAEPGQWLLWRGAAGLFVPAAGRDSPPD